MSTKNNFEDLLEDLRDRLIKNPDQKIHVFTSNSVKADAVRLLAVKDDFITIEGGGNVIHIKKDAILAISEPKVIRKPMAAKS